MILCLTDNDLIQMLGDKERGIDPANTIKTKLYTFRKDIDWSVKPMNYCHMQRSLLVNDNHLYYNLYVLIYALSVNIMT